MQYEDISPLFTRNDGSFLCARWGRPICPIVFGVEDETLSVVKGAFEALCALSGHKMTETDPELGSNCMVFFFREWSELLDVPDLDRLVDDLAPLVARLQSADANQYRVFRFDAEGAIKAAFVFLRMDKQMAALPAETLALSQVAQTMVTWSDGAFKERSPLAVVKDGPTILRPDIAGLLKAVYDPILPVAANDDSHALRLAARMTQGDV